jgi:hypothetical protein
VLISAVDVLLEPPSGADVNLGISLAFREGKHNPTVNGIDFYAILAACVLFPFPTSSVLL